MRTPVIPGFTESEDNIKAIADFVSQVKSVKEYELLAYHSFGEAKYQQMGREYSLSGLQPVSEQCMAKLREFAKKVTAG